ncbi:putative mitochondrial protein like [Argiope bruennichi]|uniref:Putative mitochondrial protein like n=1 Tax=Argiope bruennichi TaxID=94029 RepID=A0A8T0E4B2_ARGBR|nr:putative mitochondrial protein like [Argiope bruennichi]
MDRATCLRSFNEIELYCDEHQISFDKNLFDFSGGNTNLVQTPISAEDQQEDNLIEIKISSFYQQAIGCKEASELCDAMDREINVMNQRKAWILVDPPENAKILGNRWVYTVKRDENNKKG